MTIREHLGSRARRAMIAAFACWGGVAVAMVLTVVLYGEPDSPPLVVIPFFAGFMGSILYMMLRVRCPKCDFRLGQFGLVTFRESRFQKRINFCPHCGIDLDQERESK